MWTNNIKPKYIILSYYLPKHITFLKYLFYRLTFVKKAPSVQKQASLLQDKHIKYKPLKKTYLKKCKHTFLKVKHYVSVSTDDKHKDIITRKQQILFLMCIDKILFLDSTKKYYNGRRKY